MVRDGDDQILKLIPVQEELPPDTQIQLPLTDTGEPLYFLIPARKLAVQITPDPVAPQSSFNVQVRRGTEAVLPPDVIASCRTEQIAACRRRASSAPMVAARLLGWIPARNNASSA